MVLKTIFAAGCFWGVQFYFDQIEGVVSTAAGYTGGHTKNPTYEDVCYKDTGHAEAVLIEFDDSRVSFEMLVKQFLYMHDPTQVGGQGPDIGSQYRSAIFYTTDAQMQTIQDVFAAQSKDYDKPIATQITPAAIFYPAEDYHQKFTARTGRGICHKPFKVM